MEGNMIHSDHLTFTYKDSKEGIYDVNFTVKPGELVLLTGDSGCGKSTLLKCLNGLIPETVEGDMSGDLYLEEERYSGMKMTDLNKKIGSVFQNPRSQFFTDNTTAELVFPMENYGFSKERMEETLQKLSKEFQLDGLLNRDVFSLSSGERQMIALASSVTMQQKVLLFDEPSANLDYGNAIRLGKIIQKLKNRGYSIIVADHRFYYLNGIIDKVLFMENGKMSVYDGEESFQKSGYNTRSFDIFSLTIPFVFEGKEEEKIASLEQVFYKDILRDINLELYRGEITVLVGANGAGKTTLAKLLCESIKPDRGKVRSVGLPFFIMQDPDYQLFGTSVINELTLVKNDPEQIKGVIEKMGLYPYRNSHPFDLSGGQKQRLQICMALLCDRPLILFDEPTSGLDIGSMQRVAGQIKELKHNSGVLVISHDYEFIRNVADRVVYLKEGRIEKDFRSARETLADLNKIFIDMQEEKNYEKNED